MLRQSFDLPDLADQIENAVYHVMNEGIVTGDLGGKATTSEFTQAVITALGK